MELRPIQTRRVAHIEPTYNFRVQDSECTTLRVQVPNNQILTQNLSYNYYYPKPKYLIIGYHWTLNPKPHIPLYIYISHLKGPNYWVHGRFGLELLILRFLSHAVELNREELGQGAFSTVFRARDLQALGFEASCLPFSVSVLDFMFLQMLCPNKGKWHCRMDFDNVNVPIAKLVYSHCQATQPPKITWLVQFVARGQQGTQELITGWLSKL